jgi:hypothetical protein
MKNSMSERTTTHHVRVPERCRNEGRIEGSAQSRVTGGNSLATR